MRRTSMNATVNQSQGFSMPPNMTSNSTLTSPGGSPVPRHIQIGVTVLAVTVIILAMIGNTLVIYIVCTVNHMRTSTNTLIANLAVADLLMTIDIPYILKWYYVWDQWFGTFMGTVLCKFFHSAQVGSLAASVFSLVAISLDRSFAILSPMKKIITPNVVRFAIGMIWLGALALAVPLVVATKNTHAKDVKKRTEFMSCRTSHMPQMSGKIYFTFLFLTAYIIPLLIIAVVYSLAGWRLRKRKLPGNYIPTAHKNVQASSRRATAMLITVVIIFALSWFPFQAILIMRALNPRLWHEHTVPSEVDLVLPWFGYCNSAINPILYVIFSENYRHEFYRILCWGPSRADRNKLAVAQRCAARQPRDRVRGEAIVQWDTAV